MYFYPHNPRIMNTEEQEIWVFLSHSNQDFEKVRILRNKMEENGLRPLMFFLKCLDTDEEVFELLKREIDVRPRFFLCDSKNARKSKWVQKEIEYILSKNRQYITVNLDDPDSFDENIQEIKRRSQVFLSYSRKDHEIAEQIRKGLTNAGFIVHDARSLLFEEHIGESYHDIIEEQIRTIAKNGYFLSIISNNESAWQIEELKYAEKHKARSYALSIDDEMDFWNLDNTMTRLLCSIPFLKFDTSDINGSVKRCVEFLVSTDLKRNI